MLIELLSPWLEPHGDEFYAEGEDSYDEEREAPFDMRCNASMIMFREEFFRQDFLSFIWIHFGLAISPDVLTGNWYLRDSVRKLILAIKSFCPTHVTGGCSSMEQTRSR